MARSGNDGAWWFVVHGSQEDGNSPLKMWLRRAWIFERIDAFLMGNFMEAAVKCTDRAYGRATGVFLGADFVILWE